MAQNDKKVVGRAAMTQVEINACWVEAVKRERRAHQLNENFDFNPKSRKYPTHYKPCQNLYNSLQNV